MTCPFSTRLSFALLACLGIAAQSPGIVTRTIADQQRVGLADSLRVTLMLEGPAPLRIEPPAVWLAPDSEAVWKWSVLEPAKLEPLSDNRERWSLRLRVDPFLPGAAVPLQFATAKVTAGSETIPREVSWDGLEIEITTSLDAKSASPRPITGFEVPPIVPGTKTGNSAHVRLAVAFAVLAIAGFMLAIARHRRRGQAAEPPAEVARRELARLRPLAASTDPGRVLDQVLRTCRVYLECEHQVPATRKTAAELALSVDIPDAEAWWMFLEANEFCRFSGKNVTVEQCLAAIRQAEMLMDSHRTE